MVLIYTKIGSTFARLLRAEMGGVVLILFISMEPQMTADKSSRKYLVLRRVDLRLLIVLLGFIARAHATR